MTRAEELRHEAGRKRFNATRLRYQTGFDQRQYEHDCRFASRLEREALELEKEADALERGAA